MSCHSPRHLKTPFTNFVLDCLLPIQVGELYGARKEFEEIAALLISQHDESHHRVGAALHNIGIVHIRAGNYTDALDAIEEAVKIRKATLGRFHTKVAVSAICGSCSGKAISVVKASYRLRSLFELKLSSVYISCRIHL